MILGSSNCDVVVVLVVDRWLMMGSGNGHIVVLVLMIVDQWLKMGSSNDNLTMLVKVKFIRRLWC